MLVCSEADAEIYERGIEHGVGNFAFLISYVCWSYVKL